MNQDIKSIIDHAIWAPSGDNSQPWKFKIKDSEIQVYLIRNKDNPILNFNHSGTYIANGALIENIKISASHFGYKTEISLLPNPKDSDLVAHIKLNRNSILQKDPLFPYIKERHTNRKRYEKIPLSTDHVNKLTSLIEGSSRLVLVHDKKVLPEIANACAVTEQVALETQALHRLFFESIVWSRKQEREKGIGLYHRTLEIPIVVRITFKIIQYWPVTSILNKLGFSKKAAAGNAKTYASSAAMGVITIDKPTSLNYINAGQLMQRVWLTATSFGLSLQPVTGTLFLAQRVIVNELGELLPKHSTLIQEAHNTIKNAFNIKHGTLAMQFRIGYSKKATARSYRILPNIIEE